MSDSPFYDVAVIVPLEQEVSEVLDVFTFVENHSTDTALRIQVHAGTEHRILVIQQNEPGKENAARTARHLLSEFDIGLIVCIGIAGSISNDLRLGDVCYSGTVMDVTENGKAEDVPSGIKLSLCSTYYETPLNITSALSFSRTFPEHKERYNEWKLSCAVFAEELGIISVQNRKGTAISEPFPNTLNGVICCGMVTKSEEYNSALKSANRKVLAIETESGGIFSEAKPQGVPCLTIRGISDYADKHKNDLEDVTGERIRRIAAHNAASFFKLQFSLPPFLAVLANVRNEKQLPLNLEEASIDSPALTLARSLSKIADLTDERLRDVSPEYKLQSKGYHLPIPRVREINATGLSQSYSAHPVELHTALRSEDVVIISIPKNYPDRSLPWVFAADLLTSEINGKQVVPLVVAGERVAPPGSGLEEVANYGVSVSAFVNEASVVYIIDEIPMGSSTKMRFLEEQIKAKSGVKFVILTKRDWRVIDASSFCSAIGGSNYSLTDISFCEMAHFVEKNFDVGAIESEAIALRLQDTFRRFDLSAHPTYFSGINRDLLTSLMLANRRAELIQLSVAGFLTLAVSADAADIKLSRTTRERFLRALAVSTKVEKKTFSQSDLIEMAENFASHYGYEINAIKFVQSFLDVGILFVEDDKVVFALSFVESYLLAEELCSDTQSAVVYFGMNSDDFDLETFDIYAELGACPEVVCAIIASIDQSISDWQLGPGQDDILLTGKVHPTILKTPDRLNVIHQRIEKLKADVSAGNGHRQEKQKILDLTDRVRETASEKAEFGNRSDGQGNRDAERTIEQARISRALKSFAVGVALLGAGSEDLDARSKEEIAGKLLQLSALIIHHWTSAYAVVNFSEIRDQILNSDELASIISKDGPLKNKSEGRHFLGSLIDILEFSFLGEPFRRVAGHLCGGAGHRVLGKIVARTEPRRVMERLLKGLWLSDIDSERGKKELDDVAKILPRHVFLRSIIGVHLMTRVYWDHWAKDDRLRLLDAAGEIIGRELQLNKGAIRRQVEGGSDAEGGDAED